MEYRQNRFFRPSQFRVYTEIPDDVFFSFMNLLRELNLELKHVNGMKLTGDDLLCLALEEFSSTYSSRMDKLLQRLGV